jgi:hypothetical protein
MNSHKAVMGDVKWEDLPLDIARAIAPQRFFVAAVNLHQLRKIYYAPHADEHGLRRAFPGSFTCALCFGII